MTHKITVYYDEKTKQDALDTFEDVQAELTAWKIAYKTGNGKVKKVSTEQAEVSFVEFEEGQSVVPSDIIYTTNRIKKKIETDTKIITHSRPFQDLVNIVIEVSLLIVVCTVSEEGQEIVCRA